MPISNLNNTHFTLAEQTQITNAWAEIMSVLNPKSVNLTPQERQKYGSVAEQNKLVVQKVLDYHTGQPHLAAPDLNYTEMAADWADRSFLASFLSMMVEGMNICNNIRITHDFDAYQLAGQDYKHTKYKLDTAGGAGWEGKYNDLKPFFTTNPGGSSDDDDNGTGGGGNTGGGNTGGGGSAGGGSTI